MAQQSRSQKATVGRVMHEYKHGELTIGEEGPKVRNPKQAIAIALHESGATRQESPEKNRQSLRRTKAKEQKGETAEAAREGKRAQDRTLRGAAAPRRRTARGGGASKSALYAEAQRRDIPGRSKMSRQQLEHALRG